MNCSLQRRASYVLYIQSLDYSRKEGGKRRGKGNQVAKCGCRAKEHKVTNGTKKGQRGLVRDETSRERARVGRERREVNVAEVKPLVSSLRGIPRTVVACRDPVIEVRSEGEVIVEGRRR